MKLPLGWQDLALSLGGFLIPLLAAFILRKALKAGLARVDVDPSVSMLLQQTVFYALVVLALITLLGTLGVQVAPMVAGLGLGGFALGFALRDMVSNLLAGVLILVYRPFRLGNEIAVAGKQGRVIEINLRYTVLEAQDDRTVLVPNSLIFTNPVEVLDKDPFDGRQEQER
jgi:small-conductance mechanosensitive channel